LTMPATAKLVELSNGVRLPYLEQGDSSGLPAIFLHGVTDSCQSWQPVLEHMPSSIHAFAITQRGHGDADRPEQGYRYRDFSEDLAAFMDAMGIASACIVGHSMGSMVAQRFAIDHPERVLRLVLVGTFRTMRGHDGLQELWDEVLAGLTDPVDPGFVREFQESTLAQPVPPEFLDLIVSESLKVPAKVWQATFAGFLEEDHSDQLAAITAHTLIVWGGKDDFCPRADQDFLVGEIPDARLVVYPDAGHATHWEEPKRFAEDVVAFVS
jgi:non-heme chloroperoxidase